nr:glycosyl transferase domain containing protein [Marseillevirus futianmevirus]
METFELAFYLCIVIFFFLLWKFFWKVQIIFNSQILGEKTPEDFGKEWPERYNRMVQLGLEHARKSRVVFCAMIRDGEERIPDIIKDFERFNGRFKDWRLLIVENDSKDNTRKLLLEWAKRNKRVLVLGCGVNAPSCSMNLPKTEGHEVTKGRINKMSMLRQVYLDKIKKDFRDWDYAVVQDVDLIGRLYQDGFFNSFGWLAKDKDIDMLASYGILRFPGGIQVIYDGLATTELGGAGRYHPNRWISHAVGRKLDHLGSTPGGDLEQVDSAFGGCAIYRISSLLNSGFNYDIIPEKVDNVQCEHVLANMYLKKKYMNPSMVYLCLSNDNS